MLPPLLPATRALLIVNGVVFLLQQFFPQALLPFMLWPLGVGSADVYASGGFMPWQLISYGFMHNGAGHLLMNMLGLFMFAPALEYVWGRKRFVTFYLVCIIGAGLCQLALNWWLLQQGMRPTLTVGASGAIFGLLLGYAMLFPNQRVMLLIPSIPMKARTLAIVYGLMTLLFGLTNMQSNVAYFAHLGGMLFGWLMIRYWRGQLPFSKTPKARSRGSHLKVVPRRDEDQEGK